MYAVGSKKPVVDALAKAVFENRITEIPTGITIVGAKRGSGHAELKSGLEILKDRAPRAFVPCAAAMTFVNNNQIEKIGWIGTEKPFTMAEQQDRRELTRC
jgi:hypothetical protein